MKNTNVWYPSLVTDMGKQSINECYKVGYWDSPVTTLEDNYGNVLSYAYLIEGDAVYPHKCKVGICINKLFKGSTSESLKKALGLFIVMSAGVEFPSDKIQRFMNLGRWFIFKDGELWAVTDDVRKHKDVPEDSPREGTPEEATHYKGAVEPLELMAKTMTKEEFIGFLKGNAIKYAFRAGRKKGESPEKDATKFKIYSEWLSRVYKNQPIKLGDKEIAL